ncbi:hypothetical protein [Mesorhizobium marinum]|uniref:Nucleotidyl transferase AbiEii/AbiGii toxin family protein n=1 Tax=Mesorhizobium marinum TaxID=3228790 RepID=A0ABV3QWJ6_9HYPH
MALTEVQKGIVRRLAANRSDTSYVAGGIVLNRDWPRVSDDVDIFHDTDEEIGASAQRDIETLRSAGYRVHVDVEVYGCVEATVLKNDEGTLIQWMSETRNRFFPLIRDEEWGARLHSADLAVNKVLAASSRTKPRDFVDLVMIEQNMCPLGPLVMAASGKPPHFSPQRVIDEMRRRGLSIADEQYDTVRGLPAGWTAALIRENLMRALDAAERYILAAPVEIVGALAVDAEGVAVEVSALDDAGVVLKRATAEPEVMPMIADFVQSWGRKP